MNFYKKYLLPKWLNYGMTRESFKKERPSLVLAAEGVVLEVGFGSGLNLPYYKNITKLYALEPSDEMFAMASEEVSKANFPVEHLKASAESIPLPDNSIDAVVSAWTLCSIPNLGVALKEIARVLKNNGKFHFIEHGRAPALYWSAIQDIITPASKNFTGSCHLNREMDKIIKMNGFEITELVKFSEAGKPLNYIYKGKAKPIK